MDSDLAWVNGKNGRQSWCYARRFPALYNIGSHLPFTILTLTTALKLQVNPDIKAFKHCKNNNDDNTTRHINWIECPRNLHYQETS